MSKSYGRGGATIPHAAAKTFVAVDIMSLEIHRGETLAVVAESVCGKTTLARMLLRLIEPDSDEIYFDGRDLLHLGQQGLRASR